MGRGLINGSLVLTLLLFVGSVYAAPPIGKPKPAKLTLDDMLTPTKVTFSCDKEPTLQAIKDFQKQTGTTILSSDASDFRGNVTIHAADQPWCAVVAQFIQQGGLVADTSGRADSNQLVLLSRMAHSRYGTIPSANIRAAIAPCLVRASLFKFPSEFQIECTLSFIAEPKVNVIGYAEAIHLDAPVTDTNASLRPMTFYDERNHEVRAVNSAEQVAIHTGFFGNGAVPHTFKRLTGQVGLVFGFDPQSTDLLSLLDGKDATVTLSNGVKVRLHDFVENSRQKGRFTLSASVSKSLGNSFKDETMYDLAQLLRLQISDDKGHVWRLASFSRDRLVDKTDYDLDLIIPMSGSMMGISQPVAAIPTHVSAAPFTRTEQKTIPFEFDNVSMSDITGH